MKEETKENIASAISQSGFPLEHYVGNVLRKHGWRIITNRYYIDDLKNIEREIDILAYKTHTDDQEMIQYYTGLIISCKKSKKYTWCFLTRESDVLDSNVDWTPLHFCTSDARLKYMTEKHRDILVDRYKKHSAIKHLYDFPESVFAYQQLVVADTAKKGRNVGDYYIDGNEDIYNSIITSIKALDTEKRSRVENANGKKYKRYYMFHLVSVYDGIMVKDYFDDEGKQEVEQVKEIKYLNRHIVNKVDDFYIVNFTTKDNFEYRLNLWDYFHSYNTKLLKYVISEYYKDIFTQKEKVDIFWESFKKGISWRIYYSLQKLDKATNYKDLDITYTYKENQLTLELYVSPYLATDLVKKLNSDTDLIKFISERLLSTYRYDGPFILSDDGLPF